MPGWLLRTDPSEECPWTESNNFNHEYTGCQRRKTYNEAAGFCTRVGGRLCTVAEAEADCLRGTGCDHDTKLIWTSDVNAVSAIASPTGPTSPPGTALSQLLGAAPALHAASTVDGSIDDDDGRCFCLLWSGLMCSAPSQ